MDADDLGPHIGLCSAVSTLCAPFPPTEEGSTARLPAEPRAKFQRSTTQRAAQLRTGRLRRSLVDGTAILKPSTPDFQQIRGDADAWYFSLRFLVSASTTTCEPLLSSFQTSNVLFPIPPLRPFNLIHRLEYIRSPDAILVIFICETPPPPSQMDCMTGRSSD